MKNARLFFIVVLGIIFSAIILADAGSSPPDDKENYNFYWHWSKGKRPFIEVIYGNLLPRHKNFQSEFNRTGLLEVKLGYNQTRAYRKTNIRLDENFAFASYSAEDVSLEKPDNEQKTNQKMFRFGFGDRGGYGYRTASVNVIPYHQFLTTFSRVDYAQPPGLSSKDLELQQRYEGAYRFGASTEGGLKIDLFNSLALSGSYETAVVYPRLLFWKWLGGVIIQSVIVEGISHFAEEIVDASPAAGPIIYALLRNGAAYGVYLGVRDNMYWPISSEKPLTHETFRFGLSFIF
jgi:hypothetical protein